MPPRPVNLPAPEILARPVLPEAAIEFWKWKAAMSHEDMKKLDAGARERAFYVTALAEHDAVQAVKNALGEALENGETFQDFQERIADVIAEQGWRGDRIETIFRNNLQTAYSAGRYAKMQEVKQFRPYWQYITVGDERVRPSHAILHGMVFHADSEFWDENYPPNGHKCRCAVRTLSERQMEKEGLAMETGAPGDGMYTDPNTGMEYHVAKPGADKGWRSNPGKSWVESGAAADLPLGRYPDLAAQNLPLYLQHAMNLERRVGVSKGMPIAPQEACNGANPLFGQGPEYRNNCQRCVHAYELRRRGYDVEAMPRTLKDYFGHEGFKGVQVYGCHKQGGGTSGTKADMLTALNAMPDGARIGITWTWPGKQEGHAIVCEKIRGKLYFLDPQSGKTGDHVLGAAHSRYGYTYYRMDTCELDGEIEWEQIVKKSGP